MIPAGAIWIRFPRFVGDAVMMHLASEGLRAAGCPLVAWGPSATVELFQGAEGYAGVEADPPRKPGLLSAAALLRSHRPAAVLALAKSMRAPAAALVAGVRKRVGCTDDGTWLILSAGAKYKGRDDHAIERYLDVIHRGFPDIPDAPFKPFRPRAESLDATASMRRRLDLENRPYLALALGAASDSKRLGLKTLVAVAHLGRAEGHQIVALGGSENDRAWAGRLKEEVPEVIDLTGGLPWSQSAAWLCGASSVLANDSGLAHLAAACGVQVVTVFGPTIPRHTGPRGPRASILRNEDLHCLECLEFTCPVAGHPCMNAVSPQLLREALFAI
jgi:ADP-heptose:LPS heptosyltransferase